MKAGIRQVVTSQTRWISLSPLIRALLMLLVLLLLLSAVVANGLEDQNIRAHLIRGQEILEAEQRLSILGYQSLSTFPQDLAQVCAGWSFTTPTLLTLLYWLPRHIHCT